VEGGIEGQGAGAKKPEAMPPKICAPMVMVFGVSSRNSFSLTRENEQDPSFQLHPYRVELGISNHFYNSCTPTGLHWGCQINSIIVTPLWAMSLS